MSTTWERPVCRLLLLFFLMVSGMPAHALYLNQTNMTVTTPSATSNPFLGMSWEEGLRRLIDAPSAEALEYHDVTTHVHVFDSRITFEFDFGRELTLESIHFWNFHTDDLDVDNVFGALRDGDRNELRLVSFLPRSGGVAHSDITPIAAETFVYHQTGVRYVTLQLRNDNQAFGLDLQNIGFTVADPIPEPTTGLLFVAGLGWIVRRRWRGAKG